MILELPWPPTVNTYYRHVLVHGSCRALISKRGREYRKAVKRAVGPAVRTLEGPLRITIRWHPPDKRKRDWDNPVKALQDALQHAGVIGDDNQVRYAEVSFHDQVKGGAAIVEIRPL